MPIRAASCFQVNGMYDKDDWVKSFADYLLPVFTNMLMNEWRLLSLLITPITSGLEKLFCLDESDAINTRQGSFTSAAVFILLIYMEWRGQRVKTEESWDIYKSFSQQ